MRTYKTLEYVCKKTGKHRVTIGRWIAAGQFPAPIKPAGALLFADEDLDAWESEQREKATGFAQNLAKRKANSEVEEDKDAEVE